MFNTIKNIHSVENRLVLTLSLFILEDLIVLKSLNAFISGIQNEKKGITVKLSKMSICNFADIQLLKR